MRVSIMYAYVLPKKKGFTLIELILVIVVIAILATITIVAYNQVQRRAYAARAAVVVDTYEKIIKLYRTDNGSFPSTSGDFICLGQPANYPTTSLYAADTCSSWGSHTSAAFNSAVSAYTRTIPDGSMPSMDGGGWTMRSVLYASFDGSTASFAYMPLPGGTCPRGNPENSGAYCQYDVF